MIAEIITIGDEILIGQIVDTNAVWISSQLNGIGVTVGRRVTVGDNGEEIMAALRDAQGRAQVIIVTGGLGPTKDDITKLTVARMFSCGLVRDERQHELNKGHLARRGIEFNELNAHQSDVPECCRVLHNHWGTAPGMWFDYDGGAMVFLPGVPYEMKNLMTNGVLPLLRERFTLRSVVHRTALTYGIAESVLAERIAEWEDALPSYLHLAYLPNPFHMKLRLSAYDVDAAEVRAEMEARFAELEKIIPGHIVGYDDDTLASVVARLLVERGCTLSVAESCTGGALSAGFTSMSGASDYFMGSVVSYSNDVKQRVLHVREESLMQYGAVSREVAEQMAEGVRALCGTDYALATTGIAGPTGGTAEKPVGTVWLAMATPHGVVSRKMSGGTLRTQNIERACANAIFMLYRELKGLHD
ncbi:MAG: competence/damage-inducible protein A [Tidjanibacter sp.]|nr:competence/damage-inducible protein A [Tidjanibacter sp.]